MLTMKDRKVYVGYLECLPPLSAMQFTSLNLVVLRSGYRDKDTLRVSLVEDYTDAFRNSGAGLPAFKVLPVTEITAASFFDANVFREFQPPIQASQKTEAAH